MDPFQLLKKDHRLVEDLFKKIEKSDDSKKEELFSQLKNELETHTRIEETIFYPALKKQKEAKDTILEALEEHKGAKTLLREISRLSPDDETWDAKLTVLKENIEHHVEEEEGEMFKKARGVLPKEELDDLGERMQTEKENGSEQPSLEDSRAGRNSNRSQTSRSKSQSQSGRADKSSGGTGRTNSSRAGTRASKR